MNKSQYENETNQYIERDDLISSFEKEIKKLGKSGLEKLVKKINFLCLNYNPYENNELTQEEKNVVEELKLTHHLSNPFVFTNILLQMMDIVENQLKTKIH